MSRGDHVLDAWQREILALHLDPRWGARFWSDRARRAGRTARDFEVVGDLAALALADSRELARVAIADLIPIAIRDDGRPRTPLATGGTLGASVFTAFDDDEFERAFIDPYRIAADLAEFPRGGRWLFIGPSGPHPIGRAAQLSARASSGDGAFTIDFDPGWARTLEAGSLARDRYVRHLIESSALIIEREPITVLFTTPPLLAALAARLDATLRARIRGVHWGGVAPEPGAIARLASECFPSARFLGGYGNSLVGLSPELVAPSGLGTHHAYMTEGRRMLVRVVESATCHQALARGADPDDVAPGQRGRVLVYRFDRSCLLPGVLERDDAELGAAPPEASDRGLGGILLIDPAPARAPASPPQAQGLY